LNQPRMSCMAGSSLDTVGDLVKGYELSNGTVGGFLFDPDEKQMFVVTAEHCASKSEQTGPMLVPQSFNVTMKNLLLMTLARLTTQTMSSFRFLISNARVVSMSWSSLMTLSTVPFFPSNRMEYCAAQILGIWMTMCLRMKSCSQH
jgi:hypothetical protein